MTDGSGGGSPPPGSPFPRHLLAAAPLEAARSLLGARLVRDPDPTVAAPDRPGERRVGRIVEVEAYGGEIDRASHARMGRTPRNQVMFGPPGIAYVYLVYGMHHCLNVVTGPESRAGAVLIRAVEPLAGLEVMRRARARVGRAGKTADARLAAGPGLVAAAFGVDRSHTGADLCDPASSLRLELVPDGEPVGTIEATPRIGVAYAGEPWTIVPWRLAIPRSPSLSAGRSRPRIAGAADAR